jgi:hypothetical protein
VPSLIVLLCLTRRSSVSVPCLCSAPGGCDICHMVLLRCRAVAVHGLGESLVSGLRHGGILGLRLHRRQQRRRRRRRRIRSCGGSQAIGVAADTDRTCVRFRIGAIHYLPQGYWCITGISHKIPSRSNRSIPYEWYIGIDLIDLSPMGSSCAAAKKVAVGLSFHAVIPGASAAAVPQAVAASSTGTRRWPMPYSTFSNKNRLKYAIYSA